MTNLYLCQCGAEATEEIKGKPFCEDCFEGMCEMLHDMDGPDDEGRFDKSPDDLAHEAFQDRYGTQKEY